MEKNHSPPNIGRPRLEAALSIKNFIIKAIAYCISSNISNEITAEKGNRNTEIIISQ